MDMVDLLVDFIFDFACLLPALGAACLESEGSTGWGIGV
jgi:hypothetical protein